MYDYLMKWYIVESKLRENAEISDEEKRFVQHILLSANHFSVICAGNKLFRARAVKSTETSEIIQRMVCGHKTGYYGFGAKGSMTREPCLIKDNGRVHRPYHAVLYAAEDEYTAIVEVRTGKRQRVSVATLELTQNVWLYNFAYKESPPSDTVESVYNLMAYAYYKSVYDEDISQYRITQYLSQLIYEMGYDGVKYSSSLSESGMNIALFDPSKAEPRGSHVMWTLSVLLIAAREMPCSKDRIFPRSISQKYSNGELETFLDKMKAD